MGGINRKHISDLRGATSLAVDATVGITELVEKLHHTIQLAHPPVGASSAGSAGGLTGFIYRTIRGTTRLVGKGIDAGLTPVGALLPDAVANTRRDAVVSVVNGVYGDHLMQAGNPLAIEMGLRYQGQTIAFDQPELMSRIADKTASTGKVMLFVHGLCLNDNHWSRDDDNQGEALATDLGFTPLYLRYNTGLPIANNGRTLAGLLENLSRDWPVELRELVVVGHSMGGLLARSACHYGDMSGHNWVQKLRSLVCIGTPHHGAPLGHGATWLDNVMDLSPYIAPFTRIGKKRSAGIKDLKHGSITDDGKDFVPLPVGVDCYAMAATLGKKKGLSAERLVGDGLVSLNSALGKSKNADRSLAIPESQQWVGFETGHMDLLIDPGVYKQLRNWL